MHIHSKYYLLFFMLIVTVHINAQQLNGILIDQNTGQTISGARVWIPGGDSYSSTTDDGEFILNLKVGDKYQLGAELVVYTSHEDYGFNRTRTIISKSGRETIKITRNNVIGIFGVVKDRATGNPIPGIEVTPTSEDFAHPDKVNISKVITNSQGYFQIILPKNVVGNQKYIHLAFQDAEERCYQYKNELFNISAYLNIELTKVSCNETNFSINTYTPRAIKVELGDQITIEPSGSMKVGEWVGTSTPKGKINGGLISFPLDNYSYFPNIPHAALLYKFSWEGNNDWKYSGDKISIIAQQDGYLEFSINDKQQHDNKGAYKVKVAIQK